MAEKLVKTGYAGGNSSYPIKLYVTYYSSQNVSNNTSTITCGMYVTTPASYYDIGPWSDFNGSYVGTSSLTFDGSIPNFAGTRTLVSNKTFTVNHNADGTGSATIYWHWGVNSPWGGFQNPSGSFTISLPTIPRASSVSCSTANIGSNATITISRASSSFTHTLSYAFGNLIGTIAIKTSNTSVNFALPTTFYAQIPNAQSGWGTITCNTYNGSTKIGTKTCTFTAKCSESACKPTISGAAVDTNETTIALTGSNAKFVKYYSNASVSSSASARNNATLSSQKITCGSKSISSSSGTISGVDSGTFTFSATDSRGYTTTQTINKTLINYVKLTCTIASQAATTSGVAKINVSGNYWDGNFGAVANTLTIQYRYKTNDGAYSAWTNSTDAITKSNNTYSSVVSISGLNYLNSYTFQARAIDKLTTIESNAQPTKTKPVFDWGESDFNINGDLSVNGDTTIQGTVACKELYVGNAEIDYVLQVTTSGKWTYRLWYSGLAECWGNFEANSVAVNNAWGSTYYGTWMAGATNKAGREYPFTFVDDPVVVATPYSSSRDFWLITDSANNTGTAKTHAPAYACARPDSVTITNPRISYYVVGRWK